MTDEQTPDMAPGPSGIEAKLDKLLGLVAGVITTQDEQEAELARLRGQVVPRPQSIKRPKQRPGQQQGHIRHFDPDTDATMNPNLKAEMWRPDYLGTCACGEVVYAKTITVKGEQDIIDAQRPSVSTQSGELVRQAHRFVIDPETDEQLIPEGLRMTSEKLAHIKACNAASQNGNADLQGRLRERLGELLTTEKVAP